MTIGYVIRPMVAAHDAAKASLATTYESGLIMLQVYIVLNSPPLAGIGITLQHPVSRRPNDIEDLSKHITDIQ